MPERPASKSAKAGKDEQRPQLSRREVLEQAGRDVEMPPCEWGIHLVGYLFEFGPTLATGMGSSPVTAVEIQAWSGLVGIRLSPWEARLLMRLSRDYLNEAHKATAEGTPAPWQPEAHQPDKVLAAIEQRNAFRNLAQL